MKGIISISIVNQELFNRTIQNIDTSGLVAVAQGRFSGTITIYKNNTVMPVFGLLDADEFEKEYGFILKIS